jgi:ribose transport system substrate-binding protein
MRYLHAVGCLLLALALAWLPSGCQRGPSKTKVGFVTNNPAEFWLLVERGAQDAAKEKDVELVFRRPPNSTAAEQKEIIDGMLAQGVQGIAISVKDPDNQVDHLNTVAERVPLIAVDNDCEKSQRLVYIGTDNVKAGRRVGELVKEVMPKGGVVALFVGQLEPINARERTQGVLEALGIPKGETRSKDGKYRLHRRDPYTDNAVRRKAKENAASVLLQLKDEPEVCMVGLWAYNPPAILDAARDLKRVGKVHIVGFDEDLDTLRGIDEGAIYASVVQNPYEFGNRSIKLLADLARGKKPKFPEDGKDYIPERVVTRDGRDGTLKASEYRLQVEKWLKQ